MKRAFALALVILFPVALTSFVWLEVIRGVVSRAIDGSGHFAIGQIYDQSIFPDTFGWTNAYFGGMPFPNFYPPLFFWLVSLLHHTGLFSFGAAFKLVVGVPLIIMPLAFWPSRISSQARVYTSRLGRRSHARRFIHSVRSSSQIPD